MIKQRTASEFLAIPILLLSLFLLQDIAHAQVILGQSCAMSGPTAFLGKEMNRGAKAYFDKHAKDISLRRMDDRYEPERCVENTKKLLREGVSALFGYVGTPTSKKAVPLAMAKDTVFFGAFTGAGFLSNVRINPYAFSLRASYDAEIENMVKRLKEDLGVRKIGLFVQRDAFGLAGVRGAVRAVKKIGEVKIVPPIPEIPRESASKEKWDAFWKMVPNYRRNTIAVGQSARKLSGSRQAEAVILVGAYRPCAEAIRLWKKVNFDAMFVNISFVGAKALALMLGENVRNVLISQVVPNPWDPRIPIVREYQNTLGGKDYGFVSLEGYMAAKAMHKAIQNAGKEVSSKQLRKSLESMSGADIGGLTVSFGPDDHRGLDAVYLTRIEAKAGGNAVEFKYIDKITKE